MNRLEEELTAFIFHLTELRDQGTEDGKLLAEIPVLENLIFHCGTSLTLEAQESYIEHIPLLTQKLLQHLYAQWETLLEVQFVSTSPLSPLSHYPLYHRFERLIQGEASLIKEDLPPQRILFIGSGPLPLSAYWYENTFHCTIDCLDCNTGAITLSRNVMKQLLPHSSLHFIVKRGEEASLDGYDVVVIALLAQPKEEILRNIFRNLSPEVPIICRTTEGLKKLLYKPLSLESALQEFEIVGAHHAGEGDTISSLRLQKRIGER